MSDLQRHAEWLEQALLTVEEERDAFAAENERLKAENRLLRRMLVRDQDEFVPDPCPLTAAEVERVRGREAALRRIAAWDFDVAGDCVAEAQALARRALGEVDDA